MQAPVIPLLRNRFLLSQSCPILCNPRDCSLPGSSVHGFSRQEYWNGFLFPPPGDLPSAGIKLVSPASPPLTCGFFTSEPPGKPQKQVIGVQMRERGRREFVAWSTPCFLPKQALLSLLRSLHVIVYLTTRDLFPWSKIEKISSFFCPYLHCGTTGPGNSGHVLNLSLK